MVPGTAQCHCGYDLRQAPGELASPTLVALQGCFDRGMAGSPIRMAGDLLQPHAFFTVFKLLARCVRLSGTDLHGNAWAPAMKPPDRGKAGDLSITVVQPLIERTGVILELGPAEAEMAAHDLIGRARKKYPSVGAAQQLRHAGLAASEVGRVGRALLAPPL